MMSSVNKEGSSTLFAMKEVAQGYVPHVLWEGIFSFLNFILLNMMSVVKKRAFEGNYVHVLGPLYACDASWQVNEDIILMKHAIQQDYRS